ncbi:MAG: hypothetical protein MK171_09380, partial [Pirellulales bacterium]|nr:hypothetical protein [Pirellulales bacterium]
MMPIRIGALAGPILAPRRAGRSLFASALPAAMLFLASFAFLLGGHANGDEGAAQQPGIRLRVPRSLPMVGERQELTAFIRYKTEEALEARVVFSVAEGERAGQRPLAEKQVMLLSDAREAVVKAEWTPGAAGDHALSARLEVRAAGGWEQAGQASQAVVATRRRLHFHHWNTRPDLVFITEGMVGMRIPDAEDVVRAWADRGVVPQHWVGGEYQWERSLPDAKPPARIKAVVDNWREDLARMPEIGVVIDELLVGPESHHLGEAIALTRQMEPEANIAVYVIVVLSDGEGMIKGLKAADRVLVESYLWGPSLDSIQERDTVQYKRHRRYETTVAAEISEKSLLTLGIGGGVTDYCARYGITTPQELRRQLHWVRYTYPEMAGISFYGGAAHLNLNEQLRAFYADPVLRAAQGENGVVRVANIGGDHAPAARIKLATENARAREYEVEVPALKVDEEFAFGVIPENDGQAMRVVEIATGDEPPAGLEKQLLPATEYRPGLYVLGPPLLWNWEPAEFRPGAEDAWPEPGLTAATVRNLLSRPPSVKEAAEEGQGDKKEDGTPPSLYYDIEETGGRSFLLTFDLLTSRVPDHGGGSIEVRLGEQDGTSSLRLQIIGLKDPVGGHAYSQILLTNKQEAMEEEPDYVREYMAVEIVPDTLYQYRVHYDSSGYVRVAIHGEGGEKLWDNGRVPTCGELAFDRLSFAAHGPRNRAG